MNSREEKSAKFLLLMVVVIWGLNVVMLKYLVDYFPPVTLAAVRIGAAALLLFIALLRQHGLPRYPLKTWMWITGGAVSGIYLHQMTLAEGLITTHASTSSLILALNPLTTGILAFLIFHETLTWKRIAGIILGFMGVLTVVAGDSLSQALGVGFRSGEWYVLFAMLMYAIGSLFIKKAVQTVPVLVVTAYSHIIATILLIVTAGVTNIPAGRVQRSNDWFVWAVLLFSGWVATALGSIWWNNGILKIGAGRTSMFLNGMPIASLLFSVLFLGEKFTWIHWVGFIIVLVGIYLGSSTSNKPLGSSASVVPVSGRSMTKQKPP